MTGTAPVAIRNAMPEEGRCDRPRLTPVDAGTGEVAFVVPERARLDPSETPDERKRSLHLKMIPAGEPVDAASIGHSKEDRVIRAA